MYRYIVHKYSSSTSVQWDKLNNRIPGYEEIDLGVLDIPIGVLLNGNRIKLPGINYAVTIFDVAIFPEEKSVKISVYDL